MIIKEPPRLGRDPALKIRVSAKVWGLTPIGVVLGEWFPMGVETNKLKSRVLGISSFIRKCCANPGPNLQSSAARSTGSDF